MGVLSGTPLEVKLDLRTSSPESAAMEFCSSYLPLFTSSFLQQKQKYWYSAERLQSRWDESEAVVVNEQERLSCQRDFEAHVQHMISFLHARRTDKDVEFLQLRITETASPP